MNLDFLLFNAPKNKYSFIDFWGEVIFIPSLTFKSSQESPKGILKSLTNCYNANKNTQVYLSIELALSDYRGQTSVQCETQGTTTVNSNNQESTEQQIISHYIPCLFLSSMVGSKYLILYFHASNEDIKNCHPLLNYIRNSYQVNVLAMEYPGYSIFPGSSDSTLINQNARTVYDYVVKNLGFQEQNIFIMGRSVGTGVALELLSRKKQSKTPNPRCLILISPFASVKNLVKEFVGTFGAYLVKENFNNFQNIEGIKCPLFVLHGKKDTLISLEQSQQLIKNCYTRKLLVTPQTMTHSSFDFYMDLIDPLREFLFEEGVNFYEQNMKGPIIPENLFQLPVGYKF